MNKRKALKLFIIIFCLLSEQTFALKKYRNTKNWVREINKEPQTKYSLPPHQIKIVGINKITDNNKVLFLSFNSKKFNKLGCFYYLPRRIAQLNFNVNFLAKVPEENNDNNTIDIKSEILMYTGADLLLQAPKKDKIWKIFKVENNKSIEVLSANRPSKPKDPSAVYNWLTDNLGFNGIVVDTTKKSALVITNPQETTKNIQALVIEKSVGKYKFPHVIKEGIALLQKSKSKPFNNYVMFDIVVLQKGAKKILTDSRIKLNKQKK